MGGKKGGGMCWVGDFVLRGPNPFSKSDQINCHVSVITWLSHVV